MLTLFSRTSVLLILLIPTVAFSNVGEVIEQKGRTNVERGNDTFQEIGNAFSVQSMDTVRTKDGRTAIQFIDETRVDECRRK